MVRLLGSRSGAQSIGNHADGASKGVYPNADMRAIVCNTVGYCNGMGPGGWGARP